MQQPELSYEQITQQLSSENILADAAEVQGMLCGMLGGGMPLESQDWLAALSDFINQGEGFSSSSKALLRNLFNASCQQLVEAEFALQLCLPDDAAPINERGAALINWVQGFLVGFGLHQADLTACSDDVKEALEDFSDISRMDESMEEDEESEQALYEVQEYVRISSMLCFNELGKPPAKQQDSKTIH